LADLLERRNLCGAAGVGLKLRLPARRRRMPPAGRDARAGAAESAR
jgi:hypothetical protein